MQARNTAPFDYFLSTRLRNIIQESMEDPLNEFLSPQITIDSKTYNIENSGNKLNLSIVGSDEISKVFVWDQTNDGWIELLSPPAPVPAPNLSETNTMRRVFPNQQPQPQPYQPMSMQQPYYSLSMRQSYQLVPQPYQPLQQPYIQLQRLPYVQQHQQQYLQQHQQQYFQQMQQQQYQRQQPVNQISVTPIIPLSQPTMIQVSSINYITPKESYIENLWYEIEHHDDAAIQSLLQLKNYNINIDECLKNNTTILLHAVTHNKLKLIIFIVEILCANVDARYNNLHSPLDIGILNVNIPVVSYLLKHGANPNRVYSNGGAPLWFAIDTKKIELIKLLVQHGAIIDQNVINYANENKEGAEDIVEYLETIIKKDKEKRTNSDPATSDAFDKILIQLILDGDQEKIVQILKEPRNFNWQIDHFHTIPNSIKPKEAKTLAMFAGSKGLLEAVLAFHEHGSDLTIENHEGKNILHYSVTSSNPTLITKLLELGVNPLRMSKNFKQTPLHIAATNKKGEIDIIYVLAENAPQSILIKTSRGKTAIDLAKTEEVKTFLEKMLQEYWNNFPMQQTSTCSSTTQQESASTSTVTDELPAEKRKRNNDSSAFHPPLKKIKTEQKIKKESEIKNDHDLISSEESSHAGIPTPLHTKKIKKNATSHKPHSQQETIYEDLESTTSTKTSVSSSSVTLFSANHRVNGNAIKTRSIIYFDIDREYQWGKTLRGRSTSQYNCTHLHQDLLRSNLTGIPPTGPSNPTKSSVLKDFGAEPNFDSIKTDKGIYATVSSSTVLVTNSAYPRIMQRDDSEISKCDLLVKSISDIHHEENKQLMTNAEQTKTPILFFTHDDQLHLYGDPANNSTWKITDINNDDHVFSIFHFINGIIKRENPLLTPERMKRLQPGHRQLVKTIDLEGPLSNRYILDDPKQKRAHISVLNEKLLEEANLSPFGTVHFIINIYKEQKLKYGLALIPEDLSKIPQPDFVEFDCTADYFSYRLLGKNGELIHGKVTWDRFPANFPRDKNIIYNDRFVYQFLLCRRYYDIILSLTAENGHTEAIEPLRAIIGHQIKATAMSERKGVWFTDLHFIDHKKTDEENKNKAIFTQITDRYKFDHDNNSEEVYYLVYEPRLEPENSPLLKTESSTTETQEEKKQEIMQNETTTTTTRMTSSSSSSVDMNNTRDTLSPYMNHTLHGARKTAAANGDEKTATSQTTPRNGRTLRNGKGFD